MPTVSWRNSVKGGDCPTLHRTGAAPSQVLHTTLGATKGSQTIRGCPEEGDQDGERPWGQDIQEAVKSLGNQFDFIKQGSGGGGVDLHFLVINGRTQRHGMKLCQGKFRLDIRKRLFTEGSVTETGSPGNWSQHYAYQSSRSICKMLLALWLSFRYSCEEQKIGLNGSHGSLPTWRILWFPFYDSVILHQCRYF